MLTCIASTVAIFGIGCSDTRIVDVHFLNYSLKVLFFRIVKIINCIANDFLINSKPFLINPFNSRNTLIFLLRSYANYYK